MTRLHALVAEHAPEEWADLDPGEAAAQVVVGIEPTGVRGSGRFSPAEYTVYGLIALRSR